MRPESNVRTPSLKSVVLNLVLVFRSKDSNSEEEKAQYYEHQSLGGHTVKRNSVFARNSSIEFV